MKYGHCKAYLTGHNLSCHCHIQLHYSTYKQKCKEAKVRIHHHAIPRDIWKQMISKNGKKAKVQEKLNESALKITGPEEFTKDGILHATTQFVVCDDQVGIPRPQCCLID